MAAADQYYAEDIALRQRNSIAVRKARGVTVGVPPFGTVRNDRGHLVPSYEGAWLLSTGEWVDGHQAAPPEDAAVWRGYYNALLRALQLYATNRYGYGRLADKMQTEGWAFRGQDGQPVAFNGDRTRLIVAHIHTYGGIVHDTRRRFKDNDEYHEVPLDQLPYNEELAVIPWELYRQVNRTRRRRAQPTIAEGRKPSAPYPLQGKLPVEKARLTGQTGTRSSTPVFRYRHDKKTGCGTRRKSQHRHVPEDDVLALMREMALLSRQRAVMHDVIRQLYEAEQPKSAKADCLTREGRIAVLRSQIENKRLFALDERETSYGYHDFKRDEARLLEEIRKLEAQNAEPDEIIVHLDACIDLICDFPRLWEMVDGEEQTYLIDMVFEDHGIHYDLEQKRITYYLLVPTMRYLQHICCMIESDKQKRAGS